MATDKNKRERGAQAEKNFVSIEQVNCHFFPKPVQEKAITDGRKHGQDIADKILELINQDFQ